VNTTANFRRWSPTAEAAGTQRSEVRNDRRLILRVLSVLRGEAFAFPLFTSHVQQHLQHRPVFGDVERFDATIQVEASGDQGLHGYSPVG
jgi:hypothetical protein